MDTTSERHVLHGLRHRATGGLVRVREDVRVLQDDPRVEDRTYHMTLDEGHPPFDAGSPGMLAKAMLAGSGGSARRPDPGGFAAGDVEPVLVETVVTRTLRPAAVTLDASSEIEVLGLHDLGRGWLRSVPGFAPFLDAFAEHAAAMADPDLGRPRLVFAMLASTAEEAGAYAGALVHQRSGSHRRALGAVDVEGQGWRGSLNGREVGVSSLLVCLGDDRPVPDSLLDRLAAPGASPAP